MKRNELDLPTEKIVHLDLSVLQQKATELNQKNAEIYTTPFPKSDERLISHYRFEPGAIEFNPEGEIEGGLSWLISKLFDFSFVRSIVAPIYSDQGGPCFDPVSIFILELASKVDGYPYYSSFCEDLRQLEKGRRYRTMAGIEQSIPGEDDFCNFRKRVGSETVDSVINIFVEFLKDFGIINDGQLSTDGQLEPSNSRYKGCAHFCPECQGFFLNEESRQDICQQLQSGAKRIQITCPFPEVVQKVISATGNKGNPREPKVALLEVEYLSSDNAETSDRQCLADLLDLPEADIPHLRIKWSRIKNSQGELIGNCSKVPSDIEARVGYHVDNKNPSKKEQIFGYLHLKTTSKENELGLELPIGNSTYPANANEGNNFFDHRSKLGIPFVPGQINPLDSGYDQTQIYRGIRQNKGIPVIAYNPRRENLSEEALQKRGYNENGVPYAPCGRLCRSNGYDYNAESRQYVCGLVCPAEEKEKCLHGNKSAGYNRRMSFNQYPRLIGPVQRGTKKWKGYYSKRSASERINSYDQEVIEVGCKPKLRGLKAFSFSGAIRSLGQLLKKSLNFVLDVTFTLNRLFPLKI
jgi:hypothetical protein